MRQNARAGFTAQVDRVQFNSRVVTGMWRPDRASLRRGGPGAVESAAPAAFGWGGV